MKRVICGVLGMLLVGCASAPVQTVDCTATYRTMINGVRYENNVQIYQIKTDHTGKEYVRPRHAKHLMFYGQWYPRNQFSNYHCKKE